ncbi:MAG: phage holin family protein [Oscillospiraceae bacterium]|nr:phage holin family protein [Oscillospiraceae bacterium]
MKGVQLAMATVGGFIGWYLGPPDGLLYVLLAMSVGDFLTGVVRAAISGELSSKASFIGIFRKISIFILVGVAHLADANIFGGGNALRTAVIFFYISNEGISLLENAADLGLPIPKVLTNMLAKMKKESEENENN